MNRAAPPPAYEHAATTSAIIPLPSWNCLRVTGVDRASFLHNMCTNDIRNLRPGSGCEAFFTDVKGKIVAHAFVIVDADAIDLLMASPDAPKLIAHLDRYIIREDVQLADQTNSRQTLLVLGPRAGEVVQQATSISANQLVAPWSNARSLLGTVEVRVIRCDLPWCGGYLVQVPVDDIEAVTNRIIEAGAHRGNEALWHVIRTESAWPLYGVDFDDANLPQEVGRDVQAIHFRKGCYLGQETVARIDALGHVNKKLAVVEIDATLPPPVGAELQKDESSDVVGKITSSTWSPRRHASIALAMLRRGANDVGTTLQCGLNSARVIQPN